MMTGAAIGGEAVAAMVVTSDYPPLLYHEAFVASVPNIGMGLGTSTSTTLLKWRPDEVCLARSRSIGTALRGPRRPYPDSPGLLYARPLPTFPRSWIFPCRPQPGGGQSGAALERFGRGHHPLALESPVRGGLSSGASGGQDQEQGLKRRRSATHALPPAQRHHRKGWWVRQYDVTFSNYCLICGSGYTSDASMTSLLVTIVRPVGPAGRCQVYGPSSDVRSRAGSLPH